MKILIPTDFSVQAEFAYLLVKNLTRKLPMDIHFLHVLEVPDTVTLDSDGSINTCGEIDVNYVKSQKDIADRKLAGLTATYGSEVKTHIAFGKLTEGVVSFAERGGYDMIAMGTKGAWGWKEKLSGSETQMIARKSKVPVLSLMCDRSDLEVQDLLLVHDFTSHDHIQLPLLLKFIAAFQPKVHLLQIVGEKTDHAAVKSGMERFAAERGISNYATHLLSDSDVEQGVTHFTQMHNADIVCIGTHGKGGLFHASATEKLVNHLFKPLISFHID